MAETDFFLLIDTVKGESKADGMKDAMDIESFSWGLSNAGSSDRAGGGGTGRANFQDISFYKNVDKASPALATLCATGKPVPKAVLTARKAGGKQGAYYVVTLTDVMVSSFQAGATSSNPTVSEQFSLNFSEIKWEYKTQDKAGALGAGGDFAYDLKLRKDA
jgi:type VI secretion system secreted protein Hcp